VTLVTPEETDGGLETLEGPERPERPKKVKRPRISIYRRYRNYLSTLPRWQSRIAVAVTFILLASLLLYISAIIQMEPWYTNEFQEPIPRQSQWIEVNGAPFEFAAYSAEGQVWTQGFDFPTNDDKGKYVAGFTVFLIWLDDARTGPDTFTFTIFDINGDQKLSGSASSGTIQSPIILNNTAIKHVENYQGWSVAVTCTDAKDGYLGPGGWITIPDDGNDFTVRFEWSYYIEHNPDWE
jgi:hypothetical protein